MSTLVKICGITQPDQAQQTAALGADFIGINFWPQSKRYVAPSNAAWLKELPATITRVGVLVNPSMEEIETIAGSGLVSIYQLHGDETPAFCTDMEDLGLKVVKAIQVRDDLSLERIADYSVNDILLDAYHPQARGGTGDTFAWALALRFKELYPQRHLWLAGGLTPENVVEAVQQVQPYAVDVASGVEDKLPGIKNMEKVAKFICAAK
ncbi:MAG: phosphoribosylanthranilate isomerase [Verrucomicrobia bacterium]|nr:phosphoribosylanthranilate isomerase [Verrucomicrobiota bacterium]